MEIGITIGGREIEVGGEQGLRDEQADRRRVLIAGLADRDGTRAGI